MHARAQLRAAVKAALSSLATPANVFTERRRRIGDEEMPAVLFMLGDEEAEDDQRSMGDPVFEGERVTSLVLELYAMDPDGETVANTIDQMDLECEAALAAAWESWDLLTLLAPQTSSIEMSSDQDLIIGVRSVTYAATWRADFGSPDLPEV